MRFFVQLNLAAVGKISHGTERRALPLPHLYVPLVKGYLHIIPSTVFQQTELVH